MSKGTELSDNKLTITGRILDKVLPDRTKRLIFLSSFIAHIQVCEHADKNLIAKINTLLHLSSDDNALFLPMQYHEKIWSKLNVEQLLHEKGFTISNFNQISEIEFMSPKVRTLCEDIIRLTPGWLKYASNTQMRSDLIKFFKNIGDLVQKPITS